MRHFRITRLGHILVLGPFTVAIATGASRFGYHNRWLAPISTRVKVGFTSRMTRDGF